MINLNVYVTIVIRWFTFIWPGPVRGNDTPPSNEQVAPGSAPPGETPLTPEQLRTGSELQHETPMDEDDISHRGQAVGEAVNNADIKITGEEEINSVGIDTETDVSLYSAKHETVGFPEGDEADLGPGLRAPAASPWTRTCPDTSGIYSCTLDMYPGELPPL